MNWEAACKNANALAAEGQHVLVVDTISMPSGHLNESPNIMLLAAGGGANIDLLQVSQNIDVVILVTPSRPWAPREEIG